MRQTASNPEAARDRAPGILESASCDDCETNSSGLFFGHDPDGFVLCRECLSPLFYCDIGGQG